MKKKAEKAENTVKDAKAKVSSVLAQAPVVMVRIKLIKSPFGRSKKQIATIKGLGLRALGSEKELVSNVAVQGMIQKVKHLIQVVS